MGRPCSLIGVTKSQTSMESCILSSFKASLEQARKICLTCRVPFWCCQLKWVLNITTLAGREVSERESDASAPLAVTSTRYVHSNERLWSQQRFPCLLQPMLQYFESAANELQRDVYYVHTRYLVKCGGMQGRKQAEGLCVSVCLSNDCRSWYLKGSNCISASINM